MQTFGTKERAKERGRRRREQEGKEEEEEPLLLLPGVVHSDVAHHSCDIRVSSGDTVAGAEAEGAGVRSDGREGVEAGTEGGTIINNNIIRDKHAMAGCERELHCAGRKP